MSGPLQVHLASSSLDMGTTGPHMLHAPRLPIFPAQIAPLTPQPDMSQRISSFVFVTSTGQRADCIKESRDSAMEPPTSGLVFWETSVCGVEGGFADLLEQMQKNFVRKQENAIRAAAGTRRRLRVLRLLKKGEIRRVDLENHALLECVFRAFRSLTRRQCSN